MRSLLQLSLIHIYLLDGDEELKNASSQNDTPAASSEEAPVYQEFNQLPVVPSTQDTGVVTPQSSVAPVTPVAPAATESVSYTHLDVYKRQR